MIYARPGEVLILSSGCYSDYRHFGTFKCLKLLTELDLKDVATLVTEHVSASGDLYLNFDTYIEALITKGYIEKVPYKELYLGLYTKLDLEIYHD